MNEKLIKSLTEEIDVRTRAMWTTIGDLPSTSFTSAYSALDAVVALGESAAKIKSLRAALNVLCQSK